MQCRECCLVPLVAATFTACAGEDPNGRTLEEGVATDAPICPVDTGYPGDDRALCEPEPTKGVQFHYGPLDYEDPDHVSAYLLEPGEEDENCFFIKTPNTETAYFHEYHARIRPQSHHMIVWAINTDHPDGLGACDRNLAAGMRFLVGAQSEVIDVPQPGYAMPPEQAGMGIRIAPHTQLSLDLHYLNRSTDTILREAWVNLTYKAPDDVTMLADPITLIDGNILVPPHSRTVERSSCVTEVERTISLLTGHMHQHGIRFSAWRMTPEGTETLLYETYDWAHPEVLYYDSVHKNSPPDASHKIPGGVSNEVVLLPGDTFIWECEYVNDSDSTIFLGETTNDEMCNQFGMYYPSTGQEWQCLGTDPGVSEPL